MAQPVRETRLEIYPLRPRVLEAAEVARITPRMVRVVFTGSDLEGFRTDNHTDHVKLWFPNEETGEHVLPRVENDRPVNFRDPGAVVRDYTVRAYDAEAGRLVIDFVAHDHGPAGRWAMRARPGDRLGVLGPRGTEHLPSGFGHYLIAADETALPAAARWLEELPRDARVHAFLEVAGPEEEQEIDLPEHASLTWLHRGDREPGTTDLLLRAVEALELPEGDVFAWAAGEAGVLKPIRRLFKERGLVKNQSFEVDGYWRRGTVNLDHHQEDGDD
ncbi:siderophore-interacting protein [Nocardiopsis potens]|uniref:siderophore-interacting protein n=1 Tax=Nocardiopsis potens TaxID=1246458 RepID=UPI00034C6940|nr:siderophore-interacting protein [Nocardiopsis potens]